MEHPKGKGEYYHELEGALAKVQIIKQRVTHQLRGLEDPSTDNNFVADGHQLRVQLLDPIKVGRHRQGSANGDLDSVGSGFSAMARVAQSDLSREGIERELQPAFAGHLDVDESAAHIGTVAVVADGVAGIADTDRVDVGRAVRVVDEGAGGRDGVNDVD